MCPYENVNGTRDGAIVNAVYFALSARQWSDYIDLQSIVALVFVDRVCRNAILGKRIFLQRIQQDASDGKEIAAVSCKGEATLLQYMELTKFQYVIDCIIPVKYKDHALSTEMQRRQRLKYQQFGANERGGIYLRYSNDKGWGVFAAKDMPKDTLIGEYTGEILSTAEMRKRYREFYDAKQINYALVLREHVQDTSFTAFECIRTNVDATWFGNFTRFINHSCDPVLDIRAARIDSYIPRLLLYTIRDVPQSHELTFRYGNSAADHIDKTTQRCLCGTDQCTGFLPFDLSA